MCARAFDVSPMTVEINAKAGNTYVGEIGIFNTAAKEERLKVFTRNLLRQRDGNYVDLGDGAERSCAGWISFNSTLFTVKPDGNAPLKYSFRVPDDARGTYWTYIMIEGTKRPAKPSVIKNKVQVMIDTRLRIGVRFVVNVGDASSRKSEIKSFSVARSGDMATEKYVSHINYVNTGDYFTKTKGYIEIRTIDGDVVGHEEVKEFASLPGQEWDLKVPIEKELEPGAYVALTVLDYGGDSLSAGETGFTVDQ